MSTRISKEQLGALANLISEIPPLARRDAVERALMIVSGLATIDNVCMADFGWSGTWSEPATWEDG